jgi:hypothetical protein
LDHEGACIIVVGSWRRNLVSSQESRAFQTRALPFELFRHGCSLWIRTKTSALNRRVRCRVTPESNTGTRGGTRTLMPLRATVSETAVAADFTTRVWLEWRESNSRPRRSERRAQANMSHIPAMAVPMGDDPTTSRLTTERSAVELRNHGE